MFFYRTVEKGFQGREPERTWLYGLALVVLFSTYFSPIRTYHEHGSPLLKSSIETSTGKEEPPLRPHPEPRPSQADRKPIPSPEPFWRVPSDDVVRGDPTRKEMAFTFDGGREVNVTQEILDILRDKGVKSTIFLTGDFIRRYPLMVKRMVEDGHEIGNHTDTHPHLTTYAQNGRHTTLPNVNRDFLFRQLRGAEEAFYSLTGRRMAQYWRAPYGEENAEIRGWAAEAGYRHISWTRDYRRKESLDSRDWVADRRSRIYLTAEAVQERILNYGGGQGEGSNGGIVLMHLGTSRSRDRVHERLPDIIDALKARGYKLVTISELIRPEGSKGPNHSPPQ